ncbi:glycosyltransferase [Idiomarina sp. A28L]|uniref:glycosyltransferase family 4 protein n=1 Tax=Idiomarina sp. A28L TaxID=1036674 RepID=UPI0002138C48|nr:glycosyltransferase family 4 protein [Idiomarina sp. A28L]EGN74605.1 glycosyltransferase [Idiomarina sp. A28L]
MTDTQNKEAPNQPYLGNVKIARVSTVAFFIDTQLHSQISMTIQSGAKVSIIASDPALNRPIEGSDYFSIDIRREISPFADLLALIKLWKLFREQKFDIVHSTTPKAGLLSVLAGKFAGVPIRIHSYTGQPWVTLNGIKRTLAKLGDRVIGFLTTACYADSESQKAFLVSEKLVSADKLSVIGKGSLAGVDIKRFNQGRFSKSERDSIKESFGISQDSTVLLFVGRIVKDKGVLELIEAFKNLIARSSNTNLYLLMVGPKELLNDELGIEENSDISQKIIFTGYTDFPEQYMAVSDVLCIPSYREGFGTVVIEAAAMGITTIGSNIYGLSDAIVDGETGVLVKPKNVQDLTQAIDKIVRETDLRKQLGNNAQARVLNNFSNEVINRLVIEEYSVLLSRLEKVNDYGG